MADRLEQCKAGPGCLGVVCFAVYEDREKSRSQEDCHCSTASTEMSAASSVTNLANTIIGAGVLAMPHAMAQSGIVLGLATMVVSGATSCLGLYFQGLCARRIERGHASFFAVSQHTYPSLAILFDAAIAIKCFGVGVSYLIIIGDLMPQILGKPLDGGGTEPDTLAFLQERGFWVTAAMLVTIPLSFLRRLDSLKYTSIVALGSVAYLVLLVAVHYVRGDTVREGGISITHWTSATAYFSSIPVVIFAFTCHQNVHGPSLLSC